MNYLIFILFLNNLLNCNCEVDGDELYEADLVVDYFENGLTHGLEALKSNDNDDILKENTSLNYNKLRWFSIGHPILVKTRASNNNENLFHFNPRGFSVSIQMLTNQHKKLLVQEVKRKYNISIELNQIDNLYLSKLTCTIKVFNPNNPKEDSDLPGYVSSFKTFPLRLDFKAPKGSKEIEWINQTLQESESIQMDCAVSSKKLNFSNKFSLYTENTVTVCGLKMSDLFHVLKDESSKYNLQVCDLI
jgi:hypothetical protein